MPGAGKTYWGKQVAAENAAEFFDLDEWIVAQEGRQIAEIFESEGEAGFRQIEHNHLVGLIRQTANNVVIACGGGTPCFHGNLRTMKLAGLVVYLECPIENLIINLSNDANERPLLKDSVNLERELQTLFSVRRSFYEKAHVILRTDDISVATFAQISGNV
jgi:shikimate kinase